MISVVFASERKISRWGYDSSALMLQSVRSSTSGDIFVLEELQSGKAVVSRIDETNHQVVWAKSMTMTPSFKSLALNYDGSKL